MRNEPYREAFSFVGHDPVEKRFNARPPARTLGFPVFNGKEIRLVAVDKRFDSPDGPLAIRFYGRSDAPVDEFVRTFENAVDSIGLRSILVVLSVCIPSFGPSRLACT